MKTISQITKMLTTNDDNSLLSVEDILTIWVKEILQEAAESVIIVDEGYTDEEVGNTGK